MTNKRLIAWIDNILNEKENIRWILVPYSVFTTLSKRKTFDRQLSYVNIAESGTQGWYRGIEIKIGDKAIPCIKVGTTIFTLTKLE